MKYAAVMVVLALAGGVAAQQLNPVYTDDSTSAKETLVRAGQIAAAGNVAEAVREMQRLLDEQPDRLVEAEPDLFVSVRSRVHAALLADAAMLEQYRSAETARAQRTLDAGEFWSVERSRLLTEPGLEAALRVAQSELESARFHAALSTLAQLERHPDLKGPGAARAAALARTLTRYLPAAEALARRWWAMSAQGAWPEADPFPAPPCLALDQRGFVNPAAPIRPEGLPSEPLWSARIEPQDMPLEPGEAAMRIEQREELGGGLWVFPTAVGDTIYVNDGVFVAARDRFTLQTRWSVRPVSEEGSPDPWAPRRANVATRMVEDSCTVTVQCHTVIAAMGLAHSGDREGEPGLFALDARTGRVVWSALLPRLDPQLEGAVVRGPAMIDGDTVIVAARRSSQGRRIVGAYLVGLSLNDGSLRWVRQLGSAGAIPWGGRGDQRVNSAPLLDAGVVYCVDNIGIIAAIEAATGRPVWVRRAPTPAMGGGIVTEASAPWHWTMPIADGDSVVLLSPDRTELLRLDRATGRTLARRPASEIGGPSYLLRVGERLVTVGPDGIYAVSLAELATARPTRVVPMRGNFLRGRVVVAGDKLLAPVADGVAELDPADPSPDPVIRKLDRIGNVLPLESQLLVVDSSNLHSYLTYPVAQRLLQNRMDASPGDPEPAVTFADLAYRSGHPDQVPPAADRALAAIERAPTSDVMRTARRRLFTVLRTMTDASQERPEPPAVEPVVRPGARPPRPVRELPVLETRWLTPIVERLGRAAETPDERVSYLMALGRLHDADGRPAMAAEAYQTVLGDPVLSAATWQGATAEVRAEIEATRRVRQLILDRGPGAYALFEAQAAAEISALGSGAAAPALERLARRFPAAVAAAQAWARIADAEEAAGRDQGALGALREALVIVETAHAAGAEMDPALFGEVAGRLATKLQRVEQFFAAAQLLTRLRAQYPALAITDRGSAIDAAEMSRDLLARLPGQRRLPRIGPELDGRVQALPGWQLMPPRSRAGETRSAEHAMLIAPGDGKVALWGSATGAHAVAAGSTPLVQMLWSRDFRAGGGAPELLRLDTDSAFLFWPWSEGGRGPWVERIGAIGGETRWSTEPFRGLFAADPELDRRISSVVSFETPIDGSVKLRDVLVSMDEGVVAMVERTGRAAVFDRETGRLLWRGVGPVSQVHDVAIGAGVLAVLGSAPGQNGERTPVPTLGVLDVRTGQAVRTIAPLAGRARWLRIAGQQEGASLVVGVDTEVACYDLARGEKRWSIRDQTTVGTLEAWVYGDRLYLLDRTRNIWQASISTGQALRQPLETYEHLQGSSLIEASAVAPDRVAFATDRGVCIFDPSGRLVGIDSATGQEADEGSLTTPAQSDRYFVTAEIGQRQNEAGRNIHNIHTVDAGTGVLRTTTPVILDQPPRGIAILDGRIIVGAGSSAIVYSAPRADR